MIEKIVLNIISNIFPPFAILMVNKLEITPVTIPITKFDGSCVKISYFDFTFFNLDNNMSGGASREAPLQLNQ